MTWSFCYQGDKDTVKRQVSDECAALATRYEGAEEAKDVAAVEGRVASLIEAVELSEEFPIVRAYCYGHQAVSDNGITNAEFHVHVHRQTKP